MRKYLPFILLSLLLAGCKKGQQLTPDGKPQSDATKNIVRVDATAGASYYLSVASYDADKAGTGTGTSNASFYQLKSDLTSPYECVFTATPGQIVFIEVYSLTGAGAACTVYYKGVKVSPPADIYNATAPSHVNITYEVGK
jgi:hypothetical protein